MSQAVLKNTLNAVKTQIGLTWRLSFLPALALAALGPAVLGLKNLDAQQSAQPIERFFCLLGVLLLTALAQPEQNKAVREIVWSKKVPGALVLGLRILLASLALGLFFIVICAAMKAGGCVFPYWQYVFGGFATAFALGALGLFSGVVADNWVIGYLVPVLYYAINWSGGRYLGGFRLFSMAQDSFGPKYVLFASAIVLAALTPLFAHTRARLRGVPL